MTSPTTETAAPQMPKGFAALAPEEKTGPKIGKDDLRAGVIVKHIGTRNIERLQDGRAKHSKLHTFLNRGGAGARFSLWGTSVLDSILRQAKPGAVLYLRYLGKIESRETPGNEEHQWQVARGKADVATLDQFSKAHDELDGAIEAADAAWQVQRAQGGPVDDGAPPPDEEPPF